MTVEEDFDSLPDAVLNKVKVIWGFEPSAALDWPRQRLGGKSIRQAVEESFEIFLLLLVRGSAKALAEKVRE